MHSQLKQSFSKHKLLILSFAFFFIFSGALRVFATPPTTKFYAGETLDPTTCSPGDTNCSVSPVTMGDTITSATAGSILFAGTAGILAQDNTNFFFDNTTNANYLRLGSGTAAGQIRLLEGSAGGTNYIAFKSPATITSNITWTLPSADGTSGQVLSTNGTGTLSWATVNDNLWSETGSDIYFNTGKVGVGTSTPASAFNVTESLVSTSNYGTVSLGGAPWDGVTSGYFNGSSSGTILAINGSFVSTGSLVDIQRFGESRFRMNMRGATTIGGTGISGGEDFYTITPPAQVGVMSESNNLTLDGSIFTITGGYATQRFNLFGQSTITAVGSLNISSEADTINIAGAPISSGSATVANSVALRISSGASIAAGVTNGYGLYVDAPTGATNNYAATFASGNVGIGMTDPSVALDVTGDIEYTGTITDTSDERLKENISPFENGLEIINSIGVKNYNMILTPGRVETGFIAQNINEIFPQAVSVIDPAHAYMGVSYVAFIPVLTQAIQEMDLKISGVQNLTDETFLGNIRTWFASATNGIENMFTKKVTTEQICITDSEGETCVSLNREKINKLKEVLGGSDPIVQTTQNPPSGDPSQIFGCTDSTAENYNGDATDDDNSCTYSQAGEGSSTGGGELNQEVVPDPLVVETVESSAETQTGEEVSSE